MPGLIVTEPLGYLDFMKLLSEARLVLTDSGGIQEETTVLGVPCLTLRNNTERPITIEQGTNHLVGLDPERIVAAARQALSEPLRRRPGPRPLGRPGGRPASSTSWPPEPADRRASWPPCGSAGCRRR